MSFELKSRAGQPAGLTTYKKFVWVFKENTPQMWIDLSRDIDKIWGQNSINGPTDRISTIKTLLKGESLTAFSVALEDARRPEGNDAALLPLSNELIAAAMAAVSRTVFPHRALETQQLWMTRNMKKPYDLNTQKTAAAIT